MSATNTPGQVVTAVAGCLVWFGLMGGCLGWYALTALPSKPKHAPPAQPRQQEAATPDADLSDFAGREMPDLAALLARSEAVLASRRQKIDALAVTLRQVGDDPSRDADHRRWTEAARVLEARRAELLALRKNAFVAYRKHAIAGGNPQVDPLASAKAAFETARPGVEEAMRRAENP